MKESEIIFNEVSDAMTGIAYYYKDTEELVLPHCYLPPLKTSDKLFQRKVNLLRDNKISHKIIESKYELHERMSLDCIEAYSYSPVTFKEVKLIKNNILFNIDSEKTVYAIAPLIPINKKIKKKLVSFNKSYETIISFLSDPRSLTLFLIKSVIYNFDYINKQHLVADVVYINNKKYDVGSKIGSASNSGTICITMKVNEISKIIKQERGKNG